MKVNEEKLNHQIEEVIAYGVAHGEEIDLTTKKIMDIIKPLIIAVTEIKTPTWIPVTERLPDIFRDVIVCHISDKWQGSMFHNGERWVNSLDTDAWPNKPTHWTEPLELPDPLKTD